MTAYQVESVLARLGNQLQQSDTAFTAETFLDESRRRAHELRCDDPGAGA